MNTYLVEAFTMDFGGGGKQNTTRYLRILRNKQLTDVGNIEVLNILYLST